MPSELLVTGALNWDIKLFVGHLPKSGGEVVVDRIERVPGGKGGNVSVAAARILGPRCVALMACLGKDEVGRKQVSILKEEGVDTTAVQVLDRVESGQAYITVDEKGKNVIQTHFGSTLRGSEGRDSPCQPPSGLPACAIRPRSGTQEGWLS